MPAACLSKASGTTNWDDKDWNGDKEDGEENKMFPLLAEAALVESRAEPCCDPVWKIEARLQFSGLR